MKASFFKRTKKTDIFLFFGIILLSINAILFAFYLQSATAKDAHQEIAIQVTENGFVPQSTEFLLNTKVIFLNKTTEPVWIASDNHPTHELYNDFDSKQPIDPGRSWEFQFTQPGNWTFHDHLNPKRTGTIIISGTAKNPAAGETTFSLRNEIDINTKRLGARNAWDRFVNQYKDNTVLDLHDLAHYLGTLLYDEEGVKGLLYCTSDFAFGCYHGLLERFTEKEGVSDFSKVTSLCKKVHDQIEITCYHGIGHGVLTHFKYQIPKALSLCDEILDQENEIYCHKGVFMENTNARTLQVIDKSPLWPCDSVADVYKPPCYDYQSVLLATYYSNNLSKMSEACTNAGKEKFINRCINGIGYHIAQHNIEDIEVIRRKCLEMKIPHAYTCISAAAEEYVFQKQPYEKAILLCEILADEYRKSCFDRITVQKELQL